MKIDTKKTIEVLKRIYNNPDSYGCCGETADAFKYAIEALGERDMEECKIKLSEMIHALDESINYRHIDFPDDVDAESLKQALAKEICEYLNTPQEIRETKCFNCGNTIDKGACFYCKMD